jgi:hypothetical protein
VQFQEAAREVSLISHCRARYRGRNLEVMLLLIDTRKPPPSEPSRPVWEPDPRTVAWTVAAVAAAIACFSTAGLLSFALLCIALGCGAEAVSRALPYGSGLREHRQ